MSLSNCRPRRTKRRAWPVSTDAGWVYRVRRPFTRGRKIRGFRRRHHAPMTIVMTCGHLAFVGFRDLWRRWVSADTDNVRLLTRPLISKSYAVAPSTAPETSREQCDGRPLASSLMVHSPGVRYTDESTESLPRQPGVHPSGPASSVESVGRPETVYKYGRRNGTERNWCYIRGDVTQQTASSSVGEDVDWMRRADRHLHASSVNAAHSSRVRHRHRHAADAWRHAPWPTDRPPVGVSSKNDVRSERERGRERER